MYKKLLFNFIFFCLISTVWAVGNNLKKSQKSGFSDPSDMPLGHYFTIEEFRNWDIQSDPDAPYNKGTIKLRNRITDFNFLANSNARPNEGGVSPLVLFSSGGVPSQACADIDRVYAFNYWQ